MQNPKKLTDIIIREIEKYGVRKFCKDTGISTATVYYWKTGKRGMLMSTMMRAMDVLGLEIRISRRRDARGGE